MIAQSNTEMLKHIVYQRRSPRQPCIPGADDTGATLTGYFEDLCNSINPNVVLPDTEPSPDVTPAIRPDDVMKAILRYPNKGSGLDSVYTLLLKAAVKRSTERRTISGCSCDINSL
ncbi:hypothetical protein SARC_05502 [Sphaeroforma arctica JP610]|uniref:Uncharacterized protein n=1 Tax=Sphaeroforma arctica JP610 TaxID=667725 RepID=A0A0L0G031_9EUKA|nr:hypothetical protein SARC_05502 [Sphaeroforma arctica JP610]KNC82204.1 hypothetical protein SARC_05502 [Sphaeroforma arctica JP610]|eukprot:XP_014156106.1 hypothetical protein SARC_05502 [Sphaeroforma arctica JP610]